MAGHTKGRWKVGKPYDNGYAIPIYADTDDGRDYEIATVHIYNGEQEANANLIVSAVNACIELNPDKPQAVADSIKEAFEALKYNHSLFILLRDNPKGFTKDLLNSAISDGDKILSKADGGN